MRIGIVCYPTFGGSGVVATELGKAFAELGHEIHFITYKQPVKLALLGSNIFFHEVNIPKYPLFKYQPYELALSSKIVNMVKLYHIDLLHVHYAIPHAYAAFMANQILRSENICIPIVTTLHGTDITLVGSHPDYKPAVNFSINQSDIVTTVSENLKQNTQSRFDIDKEIEVIPNFINFKNIHVNEDGHCNRSNVALEDDKIITHISNFRKLKRIPDVIKVFHKIQASVPSKLVLIGDGPERSKAEHFVQSLGISDKVVFLGNSSETEKVLCYSDLFLLPSEVESFGLVALEAMAHHTPVISTNIGGIPEVNIHDKTGFLFDVGDVRNMAESAIELLKNSKMLTTYKENAFKHSKTFDISLILPLYLEIYNKAIQTKKQFK